MPLYIYCMIFLREKIVGQMNIIIRGYTPSIKSSKITMYNSTIICVVTLRVVLSQSLFLPASFIYT